MKFALLINLKHENFSANKNENASFCGLFFLNLLAEKISCSPELSRKKVLWPRSGLVDFSPFPINSLFQLQMWPLRSNSYLLQYTPFLKEAKQFWQSCLPWKGIHICDLGPWVGFLADFFFFFFFVLRMWEKKSTGGKLNEMFRFVFFEI